MRRCRVRLVDTGEYSMSDVSYKAPNGKYYSSQAAYEKIKEECSYRFQAIDYLSELLGYNEEGIPAPRFLYIKMEEMNKCGYKVIYNTIEQQEDTIKWALENKTFKNETAKISYIMGILRNNIIDVYREEKARQLNTRKQGKIINIDDFKYEKQKTKDISRWVDEGD